MGAAFLYGIYPFTWNPAADGISGYHAPPAGSACVVDLRKISEQAQQEQSNGYGFFAWEVGVTTPPVDLISLGTGYASSITVSDADKTEIKTKLGLGANPAWTGNTLAEIIAIDVLGNLADPSGLNGPKPLMPEIDGTLALHLASHSRVWSRRLAASDFADLFSANPKNKHLSNIRDVIRDGIDQALEFGGTALAGQVLDSALQKYGWNVADRTAAQQGDVSRKSEWERLLSIATKNSGSVKPVKHNTTRTETWPTTGAITASQNLAWEVVAGGFDVSAAGVLRETFNFTIGSARCTSAVSSADHYATLVISSMGGQPGYAGPAGRYASAARTHYHYVYKTTGARELWKMIAGAYTSLGSQSGSSFTAGDAWKVTCNGSTITGSDPRNADVTNTDTAIPGNLIGGLEFFDDTNNHAFNSVGAYVISDLVPTPGPHPTIILRKRRIRYANLYS